MTPGIYYDLPESEYHADCADIPSLSSSIAKTLVADSPLHAWTAHPRLNPNFERTERQEFDLGSAAHALLLGRGATLRVIDPVDYPAKNGNVPKGWTNDAIRAARDGAYAAGCTPILPDQLADAQCMVEIALQKIAACPDLSGLKLSDGHAEVTAVWMEEQTACRARLDWMSNDRRVILDYKTTAASAHPDAWTRTLTGMGGELQPAFYQRANAATGGPEDCKFLWLVQENYAPFACSILGCSPAMLALGQEKVAHALWLWERCMQSGKWEAYPDRICWIDPPAYVQAAWEERNLQESIEAIGTAYDISKIWQKPEKS